jgi:tetratricopeptide (TPR) repeat protein
MEGRQLPALAIEHVEGSSPPAFKLTRLDDGKSLLPVVVASPYDFPVEGRPNSPLMRELRWYLEQFLDYPFHPETDHADHVLEALRAWGTQAFNALFDRRDAGDWLGHSQILQVRADDPHILSWPWEALYDPQAGAYLAHQRRLERRLNQLPDPQPAADLPNERVNILLVVCRPLEHDVRYRSIARPLIELIQSRNLPAHVDLLRPPTFDQLREHLHQRPGYYHVLHFDGHGAYGPTYSPTHQVMAPQGHLIFENEKGGQDSRPAREIAALLREYPVPAAVLNACRAGAIDEQAENAFAAVSTALLQSGIRSVVAMAYSLYVSGAQVFLPAFYGRLFESGSVAEGVRAGRQQMLADKNRMSPRGSYPLEDWLLPVLYQQTPLDFAFATQARLETRESRLPQEVVEHREAYGFIGRDGAILQMERALRLDTPCILVQGLGGVGKTTLARGFLRWLDETGGLDGALWFDFRDIRSAEYVLNRTGEMFYGENFGAQKNKLDLLANKLRQYRVLMVWDNFESAAEDLTSQDRDELGRFLDAIRGAKGKVIMTSRSLQPWQEQRRGFLRRFLDAIRGTRGKVIMTSRSQEECLEPARRVKVPREGLSGLEGEERWEYCEIILRELGLKVNRADPALKQLMDQLAGHPLAMRVVLPKLEHMTAARASEALRTNIAELGLNEQEEQGRLFATLRFVEQGLPQRLRPMMGLIALHEGCLSTDLLEAMAEQVDPEWTRQRIDQLIAALANAGLVRDIGGNTYEIHPLLTSYLRSRGKAPEACQSAFVEIMGTLADKLAPLEYDEQRGPFLLYGANFHFALHLSQRLAMNQYFAALTQFLAFYAQHSRNFVEASRLFTQLAQHSAACEDREGEASAYHQLGMIFEEQRDFATASEWSLKSLAIAGKQGYLEVAANTYHQMGRIAEERRDFATAREWYLKSLAISEKGGDLHRAAITYHQLGMIALKQRDFETGREWYLKSLEIKEKLGDLHGVALTYHELGLIDEEQGDFERAREWFLKSLEIKVKHGDVHGIASSYYQLGVIALEQGDLAAARDWFLKSLALSEKQDMWHGAAMAYAQLGRLAEQQRDCATAREWYLKSLAITEKQGALHSAALTYNDLGILARLEGNFEESATWLAHAITAFQQTHDPQGVERNVSNFLGTYRQAPQHEQEKMKAIWLEAGLGPFPETA